MSLSTLKAKLVSNKKKIVFWTVFVLLFVVSMFYLGFFVKDKIAQKKINDINNQINQQQQVIATLNNQINHDKENIADTNKKLQDALNTIKQDQTIANNANHNAPTPEHINTDINSIQTNNNIPDSNQDVIALKEDLDNVFKALDACNKVNEDTNAALDLYQQKDLEEQKTISDQETMISTLNDANGSALAENKELKTDLATETKRKKIYRAGCGVGATALLIKLLTALSLL